MFSTSISNQDKKLPNSAQVSQVEKPTAPAQPGANSKSVQQPTTKINAQYIGKRASENYRFQMEGADFQIENGLSDCFLFLISQNEAYKQLSEDLEVQEILEGKEHGKYFSDFSKLANGSMDSLRTNLQGNSNLARLEYMLSKLVMSVKRSWFEANDIEAADASITHSSLLESLLEELKEHELVSDDDSSLSVFLVRLLFKDGLDHKIIADGETNKLQAVREKNTKLAELLKLKPFETHFVRLLTRFALGDFLDSVEIDEIGERLVLSTRSILLRDLKSISPAQYCEKVGQVNHLRRAQFKRFDLTNNITVGLVTLQMDVIMNWNKRALIFVMPTANRFNSANQSILAGMDIQGVTDDQALIEKYHFKTPEVGATIQLLENKIQYASSDFDWIMLAVNLYFNGINWALFEDEQLKDCEGQSNKSIFIGYDTKFSDMRSALKVPIFTSKLNSKFVPDIKEDSYIDCFITEDENATVKDLLDFINKRANNSSEGTAHVYTTNHISFLRMDGGAEYSAKTDTEKLSDILRNTSFDHYTTEAAKAPEKCKQLLPYFCRFSKDFKPDSDTLTASASSIVKSNMSNFYNYIYEVSFDQTRHTEGHVDFFSRETAAFWLPTILLLDVSSISSALVDPKQGLRFTVFEEAIAKLGTAINTDYHPIGLVCCTKAEKNFYYPIAVDWNKREANGYLETKKNFKLRMLADMFVQFVLLERKVHDTQ